MTQENKESWTIEISEENFTFTRQLNGKTQESYAPVTRSKASIYASAIIHGFQPPRDLRNFDTPTG